MSDEEEDKKLKATREYLEKLKDQEYNEKTRKLDEQLIEAGKKIQDAEKEKQKAQKIIY